MDDFTLFTFFFETPYVACSVELLGSWDNFTKPYRMERDYRRGPTNWSGCYRFDNIICDGDLSEAPLQRNGGLRMGGTYWYYYRVDSYAESYDPAQPLTTACPLLPGQVLNVLDVPVEDDSSAPSDADTFIDSLPRMIYTLEPNDKFLTPQPPVPLSPRSVPMQDDAEGSYWNTDAGQLTETHHSAPRGPSDAGQVATYIWENRTQSKTGRANSISSRGQSPRSVKSLKKLRIKPAFLNLKRSRSTSLPESKSARAANCSDEENILHKDCASSASYAKERRKCSSDGQRMSRSPSESPLTAFISKSTALRRSFDSFGKKGSENRSHSSLGRSASTRAQFSRDETAISSFPPNAGLPRDPSCQLSEVSVRCRSAPAGKTTESSNYDGIAKTWYSWSPAGSFNIYEESAYWSNPNPYLPVLSDFASLTDIQQDQVHQISVQEKEHDYADNQGFSFHLESAIAASEAGDCGTSPMLDLDKALSTFPAETHCVASQDHGGLGDASYQLFPDLRCLQPGSHFSAWTESTADCASIRELEDVEFPSFSTMPSCTSGITTPARSPEKSRRPISTQLHDIDHAPSQTESNSASTRQSLNAQHRPSDEYDDQMLRSPSTDSEFRSSGIGSPDCFQRYSLPAERGAPEKLSLEPASLFPSLYNDPCASGTRVSFGGPSLTEALVDEFGFLGDAVS